MAVSYNEYALTVRTDWYNSYDNSDSYDSYN